MSGLVKKLRNFQERNSKNAIFI